MEEIYRGHRISVRHTGDCWQAKIWTVRGQALRIGARATSEDGSEICLVRARQEIDGYLAYIAARES